MPPPDCPFCEHQNPASAKFCNECGSPLHLTPCGDCGAVNSVADAHCWRCGGLLLPLDSPVPVERFERKLAVPEQLPIELLPTKELPTEQELEQELVALEQEVQALERTPGSAGERARTLAPEPRDTGVATAAPLLADAAVELRRRPRGVAAAASVAVLAAAIAVGAYLYDRDRAPSAPTSPARAPIQAAAPTEPRVVRDVGEAPAAMPAPAAESAPKAVDAPIERRVASDAGEAPAVPAPAAAPEPGCPPAVEAMALCEWLARANRQ
jgi:hypothetical protein